MGNARFLCAAPVDRFGLRGACESENRSIHAVSVGSLLGDVDPTIDASRRCRTGGEEQAIETGY